MIWQTKQKVARHSMLSTPLSISSTISPVKNHPSPDWLARDKNLDALWASSSIYAGVVNLLEFLNASTLGFLYIAIAFTAA